MNEQELKTAKEAEDKIKKQTEEKTKESKESEEPKEPKEPKGISQEDVDRIASNIRKKEKEKNQKLVSTTEELEKKLQKIEKEMEEARAKAEIKERINSEIAIENKNEEIEYIVKSVVNENVSKDIAALVKMQLGSEFLDKTKEEIVAAVDAVASKFPGVKKGSNSNFSLNGNINEKKIETDKDEKVEKGYYLNNVKKDITDEEYSKLPFLQKQMLVKK